MLSDSDAALHLVAFLYRCTWNNTLLIVWSCSWRLKSWLWGIAVGGFSSGSCGSGRLALGGPQPPWALSAVNTLSEPVEPPLAEVQAQKRLMTLTPCFGQPASRLSSEKHPALYPWKPRWPGPIVQHRALSASGDQQCLPFNQWPISVLKNFCLSAG